jgi:hypothetical protein
MTVDVNHNSGSGTYSAWVVNVGGVTPVTSTAWGAITGTLSAQTDLQAALDLKSTLASPTFTGDPKAPTPATSDNDTSIATTAFVKAQSYLTTSAAASTYQPIGSYLTDAPSDGSYYVRKDGAWEALIIS